MNSICRTTDPNDACGIFEIERNVFSDPMELEVIERMICSEDAVVIVSKTDQGKITGYAEMTCVLDEGYVYNVAVEKACRGQGLGRALMNALISTAEIKSLSFISLEVRESNEAARNLYSKTGFVQAGILKKHFSDPKEYAIVMTKYLR